MGFGAVALAAASALILLASITLLFVRLRSRGAQTSQDQKKVPDAKLTRQDTSQRALQKVPVAVLYGTQTGTAETFAKTVTKELKASLGSKAEVKLADLDEFAANDDEYAAKLGSPESVSLMLLATYGDGEPTDNAARFCKFLAASAEKAESGDDGVEAAASSLKALTYAVFGLGNRQYEHFNAVAKAVDKQLALLGGNRMLELSLGDDDQCLEDDFEAWKEAVASALSKVVEDKWLALNREALAAKEAEKERNGSANGDALLGKGETAEEGTEEGDDWSTAAQEFDVVFYTQGSPQAKAALQDHHELLGSETWHGHTVSLAPLVLCKELHSAASPRSCLHVELDLSGTVGSSGAANGATRDSLGCAPGLSYSPGDHVAVFPQNEDRDVEAAATLLGVRDRLGEVFALQVKEQGDGKRPGTAASLAAAFSRPMKLETALRSLVDLHASPKKAALMLLAAHATEPSEAQRLRFLASPEGKEEYYSWVLQSQRSLLEVLRAFPSARPPLAVFLTALAPRLQPRFYSISSALAHTPGRLSITCAVVDDVTPGGRAHQGVCSYFLKRQAGPAASGTARAQAGTTPLLPVFLRPSTFRLPPAPTTPIIMIGPGTGIAPFRGFLQERVALLRAQRQGQRQGRRGKGADALGPALLFFGCRSREQDFIYKDELAEWQDGGALSELHVAFSRDGPKKVYVQHLLLDKV